MALTANTFSVPLSPLSALNENQRLRSHVLVKSVSGEDSLVLSQESVRIDRVSSVNKKDFEVASYDNKKLEPLWDDGYGSQTIKDYVDITMELIKDDGGPPRWFCPVACGIPLKDSPLLLYLPGMDGTGAGLVVHEKALGKVFRVQCLHIPVHDRTTLEGLIKIVEEVVMLEQSLSPKKPIYLLGESFGGCLALAVAARNPTIDLMVILANPGTSYERSPVHPIISLVTALPEEHFGVFPYALSPFLGDSVKMAMVESNDTNYTRSLIKFLGRYTENIPLITALTKILPQETLKWRMKLVESAAAYANSRLHAVTAQVLVLASGKDNIVPSKKEAQRLSRLLKHCKVRMFKENGHTILMESGVQVLTAIKTTQMYRRSSKHDILKDFLPLSITEFKNLPVENRWYRLCMGAAMFSTMEDGKIVRGLAGIPDEGPILIVGNHMLYGFDVFPLIAEFLREKKIVLHCLAHPELFDVDSEDEYIVIPVANLVKLLGLIPVSGKNFFKLLATKSHTLLYPGGVREALHRKGESCKLFWPDKEEFVRMAVKFGATIIPYAGVGDDDLSELLVDYNDMKRIPFLDHMVNEFNQGRKNLREDMGGEIANQQLHYPIFLPKLPGRIYYMFGKPIRTKGNEKRVGDKDYVGELYSQIRCEVEKNVDYLLKKREKDPYRGLAERLEWLTTNGDLEQIPSFEP